MVQLHKNMLLLPVSILLHGDKLNNVFDDKLYFLDGMLGRQALSLTLRWHNLKTESE
jgi:hypothetical protein